MRRLGAGWHPLWQPVLPALAAATPMDQRAFQEELEKNEMVVFETTLTERNRLPKRVDFGECAEV